MFVCCIAWSSWPLTSLWIYGISSGPSGSPVSVARQWVWSSDLLMGVVIWSFSTSGSCDPFRVAPGNPFRVAPGDPFRVAPGDPI